MTANSYHDGTNRSDNEREHTGLRTVDPHYSAAEVYDALHCDHPGAGGGRL